ncbi:hypothetical protein [Dactylosporangium sp. CS-033363]|uniref:hypothetical protein n=1 Tax=Dactylosporangium sp. CS-033363 TaxID=3239935 RepID=UPI003D906E75
MVSKAQQQWDLVTDEVKIAIADAAFNVLEYGWPDRYEGSPGAPWSSDTAERLSDCFPLVFTSPDDLCGDDEPHAEHGKCPGIDPDPCPVGDPDCETGDDGSRHDGCTPPRHTRSTSADGAVCAEDGMPWPCAEAGPQGGE